MRTFTVDEAQTNLSTLLEAVETGEDVLIARDGRLVARLTRAVLDVRPVGFDDGTISIPPDFDRSIPAEFEPYL
jgi:prevent-host-death family protein